MYANEPFVVLRVYGDRRLDKSANDKFPLHSSNSGSCSCPRGTGRRAHKVLRGYLTPRADEKRQSARLSARARSDADYNT